MHKQERIGLFGLTLLRSIALVVLFAGLAAGVGLVVGRRPIARAIADAAFNGRAGALFNVPHAEANLSTYTGLASYEWLAMIGVGIAALGFLGLALAAAVYAWRPGWLSLDTLAVAGTRLGPAAFWVACASVGCFILAKTGYQGDWYPLNQALDFTVDPPYRHRVLFPLLARTIGLVFPSASPVGLFLGVQFIVLLALFPLTARWCGLFGGRAVGIMASLLLFPLLVLTTTYYTFYDLGIVLFYTLGLYCLATGRRLLFLAVVGLATLNHENILLLILVSGAIVTAERSRLAYDWRFVGTQLVIHLAIRGVLFYFMPETRASALGNAWINLHFVWTAVLGSPSLVDTFLLFVWFATALFGLPHAPRLLRRAVVVLPMLIGLTVLVGQLNEARQFVAFAPVAFALLVCWVRGIAVDAQPRVARAA